MGTRRGRSTSGAVGAPELRIKVRVSDTAIGPGKIALLRYVEEEGGISRAARRMGMSFRRAWHLIDTLNSTFAEPVVETEVGGPGGGGARLTTFGRELVERYEKAMHVIDDDAAEFLAWLDGRQTAPPGRKR